MQISVQTNKKRQVLEITDLVAKEVTLDTTLVHIFVTHTTAAITTADLDPGTDEDLLDALEKLLPDLPWRHPHNPAHAPDHLLSSIVGPDVTIPCQDGQLLLGTWQCIILIEFDGPRERTLTITPIA